jgi:hypothetical protein
MLKCVNSEAEQNTPSSQSYSPFSPSSLFLPPPKKPGSPLPAFLSSLFTKERHRCRRLGVRLARTPMLQQPNNVAAAHSLRWNPSRTADTQGCIEKGREGGSKERGEGGREGKGRRQRGGKGMGRSSPRGICVCSRRMQRPTGGIGSRRAPSRAASRRTAASNPTLFFRSRHALLPPKVPSSSASFRIQTSRPGCSRGANASRLAFMGLGSPQLLGIPAAIRQTQPQQPRRHPLFRQKANRISTAPAAFTFWCMLHNLEI